MASFASPSFLSASHTVISLSVRWWLVVTRGQAVNAFSESVYDDAVIVRSLTFLVLLGDQELGPRGVVYTSASCFPAIQKQRCLRHGRGNWLAFSKHAALSHLPRWMVYSVASASMLRGNVQWTVRAE